MYINYKVNFNNKIMHVISGKKFVNYLFVSLDVVGVWAKLQGLKNNTCDCGIEHEIDTV